MMECISKYKDIDLDISRLIFRAASQVPNGRASTYLDIAIALGDGIAARTVGSVLNHCHSRKVPCHRIVYSSGRVGSFAHGQANKKIRMLEKEGVKIRDEMVIDLDDIRFNDFDIPPVLKSLREEQQVLRRKIKKRDDFDSVRFVSGLDVSYDGDVAFSSCVTYDFEALKKVEERVSVCKVLFPYIPSYLSFREIPALQPHIKKEKGTIYLVDGHGTLHPRGVGIASHIGASFDVPTIGAAKSLLVGEVENKSWSRSPIIYRDKVEGCMIRRTGKKATFVSVGHKISLKTAVEVCERLLFDGIPEPLRAAHILANRFRVASKESGQ